MESLRQLRLLLWKNWLVQRRQPIWTVFELVLPIVLTVVLVVVRQTVHTERKNTTIYDPYLITGTWVDLVEPVDNRTMLGQCFYPHVLMYAPNNTIPMAIMHQVSQRFNAQQGLLPPNITTQMRVVGFKTEEDMVKAITTEFDYVARCQSDYLGGVVFLDGFSNPDMSKVTEFKYKIRLSNTARNDAIQSVTKGSKGSMDDDDMGIDQGWDTTLLFPIIQTLGPRQENKPSGGKPGYWQEGFLTIQRAVDASITLLIANTELEPTAANLTLIEQLATNPVAMRRFAYPPYMDNPFITVAQQYLPMIFVLSFALSVLYIIRNIVTEKEKRLKEYMRVMGLSNFVQWVAYFIVNYIKLLIVSAAITILLTTPIRGLKLIDRIDPSFLFVFLMIYSASIICFCFAVSVFFKAGNTAAACGGIIWFIIYIPYLFLQPRYATLSQAAKIFSSLLINTGMSFAGQIIGAYEGLDIGVQWDNLSRPGGVGDNLCMSEVLVMLLIDCGICLLITWYVEAIFPGDEGVPQPWYFPFTRTYWCGSRRSYPTLVDLEEPNYNGNTNGQTPREGFRHARIDSESSSAVPQIILKSLTKIYGKGNTKKLAVENLDLSIYFGQITALLGHNGAGKSTTMAMLTGMLPPTSGSVSIHGFDISRNLPSARKFLGLCPQHNVLFDNLTVFEHLKFFCQLKGRRFKMAEVNYLLTSLGLEKKREAFSKNLSGGQKRKLSLAIALIGGSEVVFLDEPTSGMDPGARHDTWHVLQQEKHRRTILFTTHYMEEADLLGDRIAIIARGRLQCFGSGLFLKRTYGAGYNMTSIFKQKDPNVIRKLSEKMLTRIRAFVPEAKIQSSIGAECMYILPSERRKRFAPLFAELEQEQVGLGVAAFGLSVTTMEEVFLKVCEKAEEEFSSKNREKAIDQWPSEVSDVPLISGYRNKGFPLIVQQFKAMIVKRLLHTVRNWLVLFVQLIVPVVVIILAMIVNRTLPGPVDVPPFTLNIDNYGRTNVPIYTSTDRTDEGAFLGRLSEAYQRQLSSKQTLKQLPDGDMAQHVVDEISRVGQSYFDLNNILGATFESAAPVDDFSSNITAYFNGQPYHGAGITLNLMDTALLQLAFANSSRNVKLTTLNHPLPPTKADKLQSWVVTGVMQFNLAFNLVFAMSFLISSFVVFLVKERVSKAKHLQLLGGVHPLNFWFATWIWDFFNYLITVVCLMIVFVGFNVQQLAGPDHWFHTFLLLICYGWATLPFIYVISFIVDSAAGGFVKLTIYNIFTGLATIAIVGILRQPLALFDAADKLNWVFMVFFPGYGMGEGLMTYFQNVFISDSCKPYLKYCDVAPIWLCCGSDKFTMQPLSWSKAGIGRSLTFLVLNGIVYFVLLAMTELGYMRAIRRFFKDCTSSRKVSTKPAPTQANGLPRTIETIAANGRSAAKRSEPSTTSGLGRAFDEDVEAEGQKTADWRWRTEQESTEKQVLIVDELEKHYGRFLAVDKLSFSVRRGDCFGLLGVNGAGKTSTFQMLTGENEIDDGDATVNGMSIRRNWRKAGAQVGYCPQFSAVIEQMTAAEMLTMFARIRGIQEDLLEMVVAHSLATVGIPEYGDKQIGTYSGGTKRKLSLAIGLIGNPAILMLDEPTSGVDPASRRIIWRVLANAKKRGIAILLTSHSMDECEALCGKLAIMVAGRFKCIGSPQHLKAKFGSGYTLLIKVREEKNTDALISSVLEKFPGTRLKEMHCRQSSYCIPIERNTWSSLFGGLEELSTVHDISDYSLSQTTLEEIFLTFAQQDQPSANLTVDGGDQSGLGNGAYSNSVINTSDE